MALFPSQMYKFLTKIESEGNFRFFSNFRFSDFRNGQNKKNELFNPLNVSFSLL